MCLLLLGLRAHPLFPLVVAANRDERLDRPSAPAGFRDGLLAGRDLVSGGAWTGVTREGRFAAVTNVRDPRTFDPEAPSRGALVVDFLSGRDAPLAHLRRLAADGVRRNGYNLVAGAGGRLAWLSNAHGSPRELVDGVHAVSNALLDTPWPKSVRASSRLTRLLERGAELDPEELFALLADREEAPDAELPDTGVGLEAERALSPPFVATPRYGTRGSTLLLVARSGRATFLERLFDDRYRAVGTRRFEVDFPGWDGARKTSTPAS